MPSGQTDKIQRGCGSLHVRALEFAVPGRPVVGTVGHGKIRIAMQRRCVDNRLNEYARDTVA